MAPVGEEVPAPRPASHAGVGDALPPLRPCRDARTPGEALPATGPQGDVLQRLRALQLAERGADPARHWGGPERLVRDLLEDLSRSPQGAEAQERREELSEALVQAAPCAVDSDSFALLHYAAMHGDTEAVTVLVRRRANLNTRTHVHETPLMLAAYYRHAEVCALLLARRARADLADWQGRTPLAAARASRCGHGADNHAQAQQRCVELLEDRERRDKELGPPEELSELREQGNGFFRGGKHKEAAAAYSLGLSFLDDAGLYANRAACHLQMGSLLEAKLDARKAVGLSGEAGHLKASWRLAKACLGLGELDAADEALVEALGRFPGDASLQRLRLEVTQERRRRLGR